MTRAGLESQPVEHDAIPSLHVEASVSPSRSASRPICQSWGIPGHNLTTLSKRLLFSYSDRTTTKILAEEDGARGTE